MKEQEFYDLIKRIENKTFIEETLDICTRNEAGQLLKNSMILDGEKLSLLVKALEKNSSITNVDLGYNAIEDTEAAILAESNTIKELNLFFNYIGPTGITALATNTSLETLDLSGNYNNWSRYSDIEIKEMCDSLINNQTITTFVLDAGIPQNIVAKIISESKTLKHLYLSEANGSFNDEVLINIKNNTALEILDLSESNITDEGAKYISQNNSLKELHVNNTKITDVGAKYLSTHPTLKELRIVDNDITIKGLNFFLVSNLDTLLIRSKHISNNELRSFYDDFTQIKKLRLENTTVSDTAQEIVESVNDNPSQTSLTGDSENNSVDSSHY